ncbi:ABC transporter related protein [Kyrpidia tusciae DSM 2912]|uniref:ABC transporter related protein n=1 Tax=Kyrpidia tusciae (strain DSM 2912 / NBRC 15312 / T2) TaxID=562970 RepID=D5WSD9_KYRT2|nr:ABC transporter related protein [Kyrpidia tusciae DSM 2912]
MIPGISSARIEGGNLRRDFTMSEILSVADFSVARGGATIVRKARFDIRAGEILGLIGPNGAGKSTLIGGLLGYYPIRSGTVTFREWTFGAGRDMPFEVKQRLAYIPEQPMTYADLTLAEHLEWKMRLWELSSAQDEVVRDRLATLIQRFQLEPHLAKFPHQCSKGTLQKLMVVSAFMFPFDVLLVDEPFIGLDVIAIRQLRELFESARQGGAAILISTHVLDSAERMCQRFGFMVDGEVFAVGSLAELRAVHGDDGATLEDLFIALVQKREVAG